MLKGKGAIYILIPVNILVWGFFIYRFYTAYTEGDLPVTENKTQTIKLDELKDSVEYKLNLNYKDPFLQEGERVKVSPSNYSARNSENNKVQKSLPTKTPTVAIVKTPTDIKYLGLVKNNTTGITTALVSINGRSHLVKKGDAIDGINIKNISNDAIEIKEGKNSLFVSKN